MPLYVILLGALLILGGVWLLIKSKNKSKPKPVKVKTTVVSSVTKEEKIIEVTPEDFKKSNNGVPAGMPLSFAVCDDDE